MRTEQLENLYNIFKEYEKIFHLESVPLSTSNFYTQKIETTDNTPVFRLPHVHFNVIKEQVEQMVKDDIIENSKSPYKTPTCTKEKCCR